MTINRYLRLGIYLVIMLGLGVYGKVKNPAVTLQMCLDHPQKYDGYEIKVGGEAKVAELTADGFIIEQMGRLVPVRGRVPDIKINEFVNMRVIFHQPGRLELLDIYVAVDRHIKIYISVLPVLLIAGLFIYRFRFDWRRFIIKVR